MKINKAYGKSIELRKTDTKLFLFKQEKRRYDSWILEGLSDVLWGQGNLFIPSKLAYGEQGGVIPPNAT
jgi:hypothetical protein